VISGLALIDPFFATNGAL